MISTSQNHKLGSHLQVLTLCKVKYWNMPADRRTMRDLLLYIRADESKHREVNHTLGNLDQKEDPNPYVSEYYDAEKPHPVKGLQYQRPGGWEREEVVGKS